MFWSQVFLNWFMFGVVCEFYRLLGNIAAATLPKQAKVNMWNPKKTFDKTFATQVWNNLQQWFTTTRRVRAFDPTSTEEEIADNDLRDEVQFNKLGLGHANGEMSALVDHRDNENMTVPVKTLLDVKRSFGEQDERITYLKVNQRSIDFLISNHSSDTEVCDDILRV